MPNFADIFSLGDVISLPLCHKKTKQFYLNLPFVFILLFARCSFMSAAATSSVSLDNLLLFFCDMQIKIRFFFKSLPTAVQWSGGVSPCAFSD